MNALALNSAEYLATNCVLIGSGEKADVVWTRNQFITICELMLNGNSETEFMLVYRDAKNQPQFKKAKKARVRQYVPWSWETITGRAKSKVGIAFYPCNRERKTRWGAMDFDAHDGGGLRARGFALAAFEVLRRHPELFVILGTSGSDGWHLFAFTRDFHPIADWICLLKGVASLIGAELIKGVCEIFPCEVRSGLPYPIRAPGTWNPKTDSFGRIASSSIAPLLLHAGEGEKESPFLYHTTAEAKASQLHDRATRPLYRGPADAWKADFAITQPSTRHDRLKALVHHIYRQVGRAVAVRNAEQQYREAAPRPNATLVEHLEECRLIWTWTEHNWREELSHVERDAFERLRTDTQRDLFRILRNFARKAQLEHREDFPFPVEHVAGRLGLTYQAISKLRPEFVSLGVLEKTASHIANRRAARFRWCYCFTALSAGKSLNEDPKESSAA